MLCRLLYAQNIRATVSFAGRVERPAMQPIPRRVGGFGGVAGLVAYLREQRITHLIDATHPFAAQMSRNAVTAAANACVPLCALTRPPWKHHANDIWYRVPGIEAAVEALRGPAKRVLLAVGRMHLAAFACNPQHFYLLRLIDPPRQPLDFPNQAIVLSRGPFDVESDAKLMRAHRIDLVVCKNAGGSGAFAKIAAARALELPVLMIDRPALPDRFEVETPCAVIEWLHQDALRGV